MVFLVCMVGKRGGGWRHWRALLAGLNQIEPAAKLGQRKPTVLDAAPAIIADLVESQADCRPVNASVARVDEISAVAVGLEFEIFHMELHDERAEDFDPGLRRGVFDVVADVEVGLDPGMVERGDEKDSSPIALAAQIAETCQIVAAFQRPRLGREHIIVMLNWKSAANPWNFHNRRAKWNPRRSCQ